MTSTKFFSGPNFEDGRCILWGLIHADFKNKNKKNSGET